MGMLGGKKSSHKHGKKGLENLNTFATPAGLVSDGLGFGGYGAWGAAPFAGAYGAEFAAPYAGAGFGYGLEGAYGAAPFAGLGYGAEFAAPFGAYGAYGAEPFAAAPFT